MEEPSVFTRIINGEVPGHRIYEDERVIAILTIQPICDGHTLVIPKKQVDQIWDLDHDDYQYLWQVTQKIALHLRKVMNVERVGLVIKGFDVPHTHIHLIPCHQGMDFDPQPVPPIAENDQLAAIAEQIKM